MSVTSYNVDHARFQQPKNKFPTLNDLRKRAYVDKSEAEKYNVKAWINSVYTIYQQGDSFLLENDFENAYVSYMRGWSITLEIIKLHSEYNQIRSDPVYLSIKQRTNDEISKLLPELAIKIETMYKSAAYLQRVDPTIASNNPYAYNPYHSTYSNHSPLQHNIPLANTSVSSLTQAMSDNLNLNDTSNIQLPNWTNNTFSNSLLIEPEELMRRITAVENPSSILLIDVRPRDIFVTGCIKHKWIIQLDPGYLQREINCLQIQEVMASSQPETEKKLFLARARFDLIVYYDQNSTSIHGPLNHLKNALESQQLRRSPVMLKGGMDSWRVLVGKKGIYKFPINHAREKKHWFESSQSSSASNASSEYEHRSLYDYFTGKPSYQQQHQQQQQAILPTEAYNAISVPQPLPTAVQRESSTTRYPELLSSTSESQRQSALQQQQQQQPENVRPLPASYSKLHRRRTFIDNPFNGFTNTTSQLYDVPPYHKPYPLSVTTNHVQSPRRPSSTDTNGHRPSTLTHHVSSNNIHASPTSSSFSQLGSTVAVGTTGLKNLGNTCYMNSIIQCLSGTIPLARYFISGVFKQHLNRRNKIGTGGVLTERFAELLRVMWSQSYNFVSPMTFREAIARFAPRFSGTDQQDSQEFLVFLLDGLHEDLNSASSQRKNTIGSVEDDARFEKLPDWQASALSWEKYLKKNSSIIISLFQGQYRSRLTCHSCQQTSTTYNAFMSLSLPIPAKKLRISSVTLNQCLDYFVKEETLEKEDAWKCPQCKKKRKASKQLTLMKLPDILLIHLKRFSVDGLFKNKLDTFVKCPTRSLDLSAYVPMSATPSPPQDRPSFVYDLFAVSNHYGSLTGGHYTACVRDDYANKWHYFDDSKFSLCDENKVVTKAAYNLFYVRSNVK